MMITKEKVVVVIPYFHDNLSEVEQISLNQCNKILHEYDKVLVIPQKLKNKVPPTFMVEVVPDEWLDSIDSYNQMMVNIEFYKRFIKYEYILVHQLDALVFSDRLLEFCNMGYDYVGAPWLTGRRKIYNFKRAYFYVGNGGLSLRRVKTFINICETENPHDISIPEDVFWGFHRSEYFKVPDIDVAITFAMEEQIKRSIKMNHDDLPFGCHAWHKFDLEVLKPYLIKYNIPIPTTKSPYLDADIGWNGKDLYDATENDLKEVIHCPANKNIRFVVWGTGQIGEKAFALFSVMGIGSIVYVDNDHSRQGGYLYNKEIHSLEDILQDKEKSNIFIIAIGVKNRNAVKEQLENIGYIFEKNIFFYTDIRRMLTEKMYSEWFLNDKTSVKRDEIPFKSVRNEQ